MTTPPFDIEVSHQFAERIYTYFYIFDPTSSFYTIFRSDNGGQDWIRLLDVNPNEDIIDLAVAPSNDAVLYLGGHRGGPILYRSSDAGQSWTGPIGDWSGTLTTITVDPNAPQTLYAATSDGLHVSTDGGTSFTHLGLDHVTSVGLCPQDSQLVYSGTDRGVFRSESRGDSWASAGDFGDAPVRQILVDPLDCNTVYANVDPVRPRTKHPAIPAGVYRSSDGGRSWNPLSTGIGARALGDLTVDTANPQSAFVASGDRTGIWKYTFGPASRQDYGISIDDGATQADSLDVTLSLSARPGTTHMIISNDGGFADATWEPFDNEKDWTLQACGGVAVPSTVYAKFRTLGEISGQYQDDIVIVTGGSVGGATIPPAAPMPLSPWVVVPGLLVLGLGATAFWLERRKK